MAESASTGVDTRDARAREARAEDRGCLKSYARIFRFLFARLTLMLGSQMRQSRHEGALMMDDDEKEGAKRAEPARQSKKSIEEVLKRVARPTWRSPLFCWLVEHHDALRQNEAETGRGVPWRELCVEFVGLGITLADGRPVKPATARITWQRVRKELVRVEKRRARERAEREARRAADPRRNMPSRFTGSFPAPLADRQPPLATTSSTAKLPAMNIQRGPKAGVPAAVGEADRSHPHRMDHSGGDDFDAFGSADARRAGADRGLGGTPLLGGLDHYSRQ